ncbi:MAG: GNAT family N-acetyltransferase [Bacteroidia bacterium]|nr:GNAT family N-acetyltransferase [Bacteroidia bacterium]
MISTAQLSVREMSESDIPLIADYWLFSDPEYLTNMGVDLVKVPSRNALISMLTEQLSQEYHEKKSYCIIWELENEPIGHSNVNSIVYGDAAAMHLHIWKVDVRRKGFGSSYLRMTLPYFFNNLKIENLYCEPYSLNPSPNKTLERLGFKFIKTYTTIPGSLNFEQTVNRWEMSRWQFEKLYP